MHHTTCKALSEAIENLSRQFEVKADELRRREESQGTYHDVTKMTKLRAELESLDKRIERALDLLESGNA